MKGPRRLSTRLSVSFVILFLLTFVAAAAVTLYYAAKTFDTAVDANLQGVAETVEQRIAEPDTVPHDVLDDLSSAVQFIELRDTAGRLQANSTNLATDHLPTVSRSGKSPTRVAFRTAKFRNSSFRIVSYPLAKDGVVSGYVVAGAPIPAVNDSIGSLAVVLVAAGVVGLTIGSGGTVWLSRREARPLKDLADAVHETSASGFEKPIERTKRGSQEADELREAFATLVERQREVIQRERAFFADSSHVLRTPLAVLQGDLEMLEQGVYGKERQEVVVQARSALDTMSRAVSGLLLLSREPEKPGVDWEVVDLAGLLTEVVNEARVASPGLSFTATLGEGPDVAGDPHQLRDLFVSIVENACRYTPAGGCIEVETRLDEDGLVRVEVRDNGIGLGDLDGAHALERFTRGKTARRMFPGGTGLGLAIADRIAKIHGGSVTLVSKPEGGAIATITLPLLG